MSKRTVQNTSAAPVVFIGHGSPMNAIANNSFTRALVRMRGLYPRPKAILCVSAHWMTEGTWITRMIKPKTIHDFYGFPPELFQVQYPAPGSPEIADFICKTVEAEILPDEEMWGLDHGSWAVLRHMFPEADIPVLQLSLHMEQPPKYHFELGKRLGVLRDHGILIVGSGNIVHNLRSIKWEPDATPFDWALRFDNWVKEKIEQGDFAPIVNEFSLTEAGKLSVPTNEHYYPLLYILGASRKGEAVRFEHEEIQNGSISMRSLSFGAFPLRSTEF